MDMGMSLQLLTPSMQHAEEPDLRPEMLGIASDFEQGFGTGTKEQAVEEFLVLQGEGRQPMRKGEDEVGVRGGQDFPAARLDPTVAGVGLALRAVSIAAAVVRDDAMPAAGALIQVPTQDGGANVSAVSEARRWNNLGAARERRSARFRYSRLNEAAAPRYGV